MSKYIFFFNNKRKGGEGEEIQDSYSCFQDGCSSHLRGLRQEHTIETGKSNTTATTKKYNHSLLKTSFPTGICTLTKVARVISGCAYPM
jgi:hypothetical protein